MSISIAASAKIRPNFTGLTDSGRRITDALEVFPKLERQPDGFFQCRFFLHGSSHVNAAAQERLQALVPAERLNIALELTNPTTGFAVQVQTEDYFMIGWAPRYLVTDLARAITASPGEFAAHVVRLNPLPAPSRQRLLVEFRSGPPNTSRCRQTSLCPWSPDLARFSSA
jgi:hypothetical protein